jgi:hypothetical protein
VDFLICPHNLAYRALSGQTIYLPNIEIFGVDGVAQIEAAGPIMIPFRRCEIPIRCHQDKVVTGRY